VSIDARLFIEALLFAQAASVLIEPKLREIVAAIWPNGWRRKDNLPMLARALDKLSNYEVVWQNGLWRPVVARWRPFANADLDTPVPIDVRQDADAPPTA